MSRDFDGDGPIRVGDLLPGAAKPAGLDDAAAAGRIWGSWRSIAGDVMAEHVSPSSLRRGVLRLHADSPSWATEISYLADELRKRINELLGRDGVKEIRVWTGPDRPARPVPTPSAGGPPPQRKPGAGAAEDPAQALSRAREAWARRTRGRGRSEGP